MLNTVLRYGKNLLKILDTGEAMVRARSYTDDYEPEAVPYIDQTNKMMVVEPNQLFDQRFAYGLNSESWLEWLNQNGSRVYLPERNGVALRLPTNAVAGDAIGVVSRDFFPYNPNTVVSAACGVAFDLVDGLEQGWGLVSVVDDGTGGYEIKDGYLLRSYNGVMQHVKYSSAGGAIVEEVIEQNRWIDKADGRGKSRLILSFKGMNMLEVRHAWYGAGSAPLKSRLKAKTYTLNRFDGSGEGNPTKLPIIANPNLSICYYQRALKNITNPPDFVHYGISVQSNGGRSPIGKSYAVRSGEISVSGGTFIPILSIRLKLTFQGKSNVQGYITGLKFALSVSSRPAEFAYVRNASLTGASFADITTLQGTPVTDSMVEADTTATAVDGTPREYISLAADTKDVFTVGAQDIIKVNSLGTATDTLTLCARLLSGGSGTVLASASWIEVY